MAQLTQFETHHIDQAQALSASVGWPHRVEDWALSLRLGEGRVLVVGGQVIGTIIWWHQGDSASLGMVIVAQSHRKQGHGARLVSAALDALGGRRILLHATPDGEPGYRRAGFVPVGQVRQHTGLAGEIPMGDRVAQVNAGDMDDVMAFDAHARGWTRGPLLRALSGLGTCWAVRDAGAIAGYAIARRQGHGIVIGPIAAKDSDVAKALILQALSAHPGEICRVDTDPELGLCPWLTELGLPQRGSGTVMMRGPDAERLAGAPRIYGLASQAFG